MVSVPWERRTVERQREEFVQAARQRRNFSALCREYAISRKTGYKWVARGAAGEPLTDRSRRPRKSGNKISPDLEQEILALRTENPGWGAKTIHSVLERQGQTGLPCIKTVNNVLKRNGCILEEESLKRQPYLRFEKEHCNDLWQTDFKGEFLMQDGAYCYPLDILDDHSRFVLKIAPHTDTRNVVIPVFTQAFREFGLPDAILSDNVAQFAGFKRGYTQFERWLMDLGILPIHGRIKHPQTQGKIERFHRTMKSELLKHTAIQDIDDAKCKLDLWRHKYNFQRPHEALGMRCPGEVYTPSTRQLPHKIPAVDYSGSYHVIKVNSWGYVRFDRYQVYLSETMIGAMIEFRPSPDGSSFAACYRNFKIAEFDTSTGTLIHRTISRL